MRFKQRRNLSGWSSKALMGRPTYPLSCPPSKSTAFPIPAIRRGQFVEVFVPYLSTELLPAEAKAEQAKEKPKEDVRPDQTANTRYGICPDPDNLAAHSKLHEEARTKTIIAAFYRIDPQAVGQTPKEDAIFKVKLDQPLFDQRGGGQDYPFYPVIMCINLQSRDAANVVVKSSGENSRLQHGNEAPRTGVEPVLGNNVGVQ